VSRSCEWVFCFVGDLTSSRRVGMLLGVSGEPDRMGGKVRKLRKDELTCRRHCPFWEIGWCEKNGSRVQ